MLVHDPSFQHRLRLIETGTLPAERGNREGGKRVLYRVMLAPHTPLRVGCTPGGCHHGQSTRRLQWFPRPRSPVIVREVRLNLYPLCPPEVGVARSQPAAHAPATSSYLPPPAAPMMLLITTHVHASSITKAWPTPLRSPTPTHVVCASHRVSDQCKGSVSELMPASLVGRREEEACEEKATEALLTVPRSQKPLNPHGSSQLRDSVFCSSPSSWQR